MFAVKLSSLQYSTLGDIVLTLFIPVVNWQIQVGLKNNLNCLQSNYPFCDIALTNGDIST